MAATEDSLLRTPLYDRHIALGAKVVEFGGWAMPVQYPTGIVAEHLATRKTTGLFDISHMGRFAVRGAGAVEFLQHVLTNNCQALDVGLAQYTIIPNETGGAIDDAYLYRFVADEFLLVVNAANRLKDWAHLQEQLAKFDDVEMTDRTNEIVMLSLQGPTSRAILEEVIEAGPMPEPARNSLCEVTINAATVKVGRTGYTGEPLCFELFIPRDAGEGLWDLLIAKGATPVGLGGRDTLRLEAAMPLYGHEFGLDGEGNEIPICAVPLAKFAVSFSPLKGDFIGKAALGWQYEALKKIMRRDTSLIADLPRKIAPVALAGRGVARAGAKVTHDGKHVGYITSGTMVPLWGSQGVGLSSRQTDEHQLRSICLAYIDSDIYENQPLTVDIRDKTVPAVTVKYHMRSEAPPFARPIIHDFQLPAAPLPTGPAKVKHLLDKALANTVWRQRECINLIPSEMTISPMARLLSVMDPAGRYAEHKKSKAFYDADIFYYQGTGFIDEVERTLEAEMLDYLGCAEAETRLISGQMANATVFSAMVDYINRTDRKIEQRRMRQVMNNHIGKGGHLSSQPMGALRDFVSRDPRTERPAVVNFPVLPENQYKIDVPAALKLIDEYRPELIILGKSMVLHTEPVAEIRQFLTAANIDSVVMYDMAHVLGLIGPHFQMPFEEGADLVTGSTHKTFFGTQRGVIGGRFTEDQERYELWEAVRRRTFPGAVSNHHLGTMVGLLMSVYEMNHFKEEYQPKVIANAKAFAKALADTGLNVAGDSEISYTQTHQVIIHVGYAHGPEIAERLEANNIICNYQACPDEESFTASGALRMGVSEMTRFGMGQDDFKTLAGLIHDVIADNADVTDKVKSLRSNFTELQFCFSENEYEGVLQKLHKLL
ncbi:MAG: glycine cleavage system aminomethyltransferase GcvT [Phycisphaerae bacterium]|nr:glycine cleavage system aminomethyltransferase GcvT [Phycisphaerae bacterium]